jgi:hypothetical protein
MFAMQNALWAIMIITDFALNALKDAWTAKAAIAARAVITAGIWFCMKASALRTALRAFTKNIKEMYACSARIRIACYAIALSLQNAKLRKTALWLKTLITINALKTLLLRF